MITPTIMISDVPPNETLAPTKPLKTIGSNATIERPIAPMKITCFKIAVK